MSEREEGADGRLEALEWQLAALTDRVLRLEQAVAQSAGAPPAPAPAPSGPVAPPVSAPPAPPSEPATPPPAAPPIEAPAALAPRPARPSPAARTIDLEDVFSTRVLAWLGGIAVVLGVAFFVAVAIGRGWIDEPTRIALAFAGSLGLLAAGVWLRERRGATQASLAAVGAAIAALYLTLTAAVQLYHLIPTALGLGVAFAVGALATSLAVRWEAAPIAGLGIVGALLAPLLVEAGVSNGTTGFILLALGPATAVLVWRKWDWLALTAFVVTVPQALAWALQPPGAGALIAGTAAFWVLWVAGALGHEVRVSAPRPRASSSLLLTLSALVAAAAGYAGAREIGDPTLGDAWLAGLSVLHLVIAGLTLRSERVARPIGLLAGAQGIALADLAFGLAAGGPGVAVGWAAGAVLLTGLPRVLARDGRLSTGERSLVQMILSAQLVLATGHLLLFDAPPQTLAGGVQEVHDLPGAVASIVSVGISAVLSARFGPRDPAAVARAFDVLAMAALVYLTAVVLDGPAVAVVWTVEAVALAELARRTGDDLADAGAAAFLFLAAAHLLAFEVPVRAIAASADDLPASGGALVALALGGHLCARFAAGRRAGLSGAYDTVTIAALAYLAAVALDGWMVALAWASEAILLAANARRTRDDLALVSTGCLLVLAGLHALWLDGPPNALVYGLDDVAGGAAALAAFAAACFVAAGTGFAARSPDRRWLEAIGAASVVYLCSVLIVSAFQPEGAAARADLLDLDVRQQGQVVLSAFWSVTGLGALVAGLMRDERRLRLGGLALLGLAIAKVFLYDLSTLDSIYRVLSFIGLGLLLLMAAYAYQRMRPRLPDTDLREEAAPR